MVKKKCMYWTLMVVILWTNSGALAVWSTPVLLDELNDPIADETAFQPGLSKDCLTMYFCRFDSGGLRYLWEAVGDTPTGPFNVVRKLSELGNTTQDPWISSDGLRLYYAWNKWSGGSTEGDVISMASRNCLGDTWTHTTRFTEIHEDGFHDKFVSLTEDELTIFFQSIRTGKRAVWTATRSTIGEPFSSPVLVDELNDGEDIHGTHVLPDGLTVYFTGLRDGDQYPKLYRASRLTVDEPFGNIEKIELDIDDMIGVYSPYVTADEKLLYFSTPEGVFVSSWVNSPYEEAVEKIQDAIEYKNVAIENIDNAYESEMTAFEALGDLLESGDFDVQNRSDIIRARHKLIFSMWRQVKAKIELRKSIRQLELSLQLLTLEPESDKDEQLEPFTAPRGRRIR
jgi:hypothetical protein